MATTPDIGKFIMAGTVGLQDNPEVPLPLATGGYNLFSTLSSSNDNNQLGRPDFLNYRAQNNSNAANSPRSLTVWATPSIHIQYNGLPTNTTNPNYPVVTEIET
jgi:hypothetical protein